MGNSNSNNNNNDKKIIAGAIVGGVILGAVTFGVGTAIVAGVAGGKAAQAYHESTKSEERRENNNTPMFSSSGGGVSTITKTSSSVWKGLNHYRGGIKTNGLSGSKRNYFTWDHTHHNIEKYNHIGKHLGSVNPITGEMVKGAVAGRVLPL